MKVGVIGAGTMGVGIAQVFAQQAEYEVRLCSSSLASAEQGKARVERALKSRVDRGRMTLDEASVILDKIVVSSLSDCGDCDLIVESIRENMDEKKVVFARLSAICRESCILATNTSSLSVTELSVGIRQPVIGMHFYNPAPVMKLVEVVVGLNTPKDTAEQIIRIAKEIGKTPIEVKDSAGFLVNRMLIPMINEAISIYAEGIASAESIDTAMKLGANHPMGPLALADFIGLDVCLAILEVLQAETGDAKYKPHPLLRKMVRGGWLGVKSGRGFYQYGKQ